MNIEQFKNDFNSIYESLIENNDKMAATVYKTYTELINHYNNNKINRLYVEIKKDKIYFHFDNSYKWYVCTSLYLDRISFELSRELKQKVKKYCVVNNISMKDLIIELLYYKVKNN